MLCSNAQITVLIHYLNFLSVLLQSTVVGGPSTGATRDTRTAGLHRHPWFPGEYPGDQGNPRPSGGCPRHKSGHRVPIPSAVPGSPLPRQRRGRAPRPRDAAAPAQPARCRGDAPSPRRPSRCPPWPPASTLTRRNKKNHHSRHESRQRHRSMPVLLWALLRLAHRTFPILREVSQHGPWAAFLALTSIEEKAVLPALSASLPAFWMAAVDDVSLLTLVISEGQTKKRKTNGKTPLHVWFHWSIAENPG